MKFEAYDDQGRPLYLVSEETMNALKPLIQAAQHGGDFTFHFSVEAAKAVKELGESKSKMEF
ncbi:hypothetical protein V6L78_26845 [Pseudomonas canadensis]|uniref:hypothetical protein n=1 Tax=Pseudomonas canadensis TaxID=915099 RepID=UPI0030D2EEEC